MYALEKCQVVKIQMISIDIQNNVESLSLAAVQKI